MNFKNSEFLMLVAAFLLGYFVQEMMKGCQVMEGLEESNAEADLHMCIDLQNNPPTPGGQYNKNSVKNCLDELCRGFILQPPAATDCVTKKDGDRCYNGSSCYNGHCTNGKCRSDWG